MTKCTPRDALGVSAMPEFCLSSTGDVDQLGRALLTPFEASSLSRASRRCALEPDEEHCP